MPEVKVRKFLVSVEEIFHEGGPPAVRRESVVQGAGPQPVAVARVMPQGSASFSKA